MPKGFSERPIGIFDSGVGGLTVMKEIMRQLPEEHILYLGDTARVPYGTRSPETVLRYSHENARFLIARDIKILVVACNTSSSIALLSLGEKCPVPVIGVVDPGARAAVRVSRKKKIAVIGTDTTIKSGSYEKAIKSFEASAEVTGVSCPLFVPLIEEGWLEGDVVTLTARKYLSPVTNNGADTLVLGCTHYPMIKNVIADIVGISLIDSAVETAKEVKRILSEQDMLCEGGAESFKEFYVTDFPEKFVKIGERFLDHKIENISKIELGN